MFCPKCGSQIPDGSAFCGKCGNKFKDTSKPIETTGGLKGASSSSGVDFALRGNKAGLNAVSLVVVAIIFTFIPWFDISSQMSTIGGAASGLTNGLSSLAGGSGSVGNSFEFQDSYAVWTLIGLADTFKSYVGVYSAFGGSGAQSTLAIISGFSWACFILWVASVAFGIWGAVSAVARGSMGILRVGCVLLAATTLVFSGFTGAMGSDTGTANTFPALCLLIAIAAFFFSLASKRKA